MAGGINKQKPNKIDLEGAELVLRAYHKKQGEVEEIFWRQWEVHLADGNKFQLQYYQDEWKRWVDPGPTAALAPHWRKANIHHTEKLTAWLHSHPDYVPNTPEYRFSEGLMREILDQKQR
ncbi:TPA: hypothetical protein LU109_003614 [Enterobacter hormaechei subsp. xiangfangensis]|nr:hypothetical protein [Enterobacter hormaechei subsp. xiangfangensis]